MDNKLTLSQFINSPSDYLKNDTTLIFSPGNYSLESELFVENVHSFSMLVQVWPGSSMKAVITCGPNARFEFSNVSFITVSEIEFVGCFENHVLSVDRFLLKNSAFFGNGQPIFNGTVLSIKKSAANLDKVTFISTVEKLNTSATPQALPEDCSGLETSSSVIVIILKSSNVRITQSHFEGNNVGLGAVIYDLFGSDIMISNTIFVNNTATQYCSGNCCFPGGIVYVNSWPYRSTVKIYQSRFEGNVGVAFIIYGDSTYTSEVSIIHSEFVNNTILEPNPQILINGTFQSNSLITLVGVMTNISLSEFINNRVSIALVYALHYTTAENNLTNNVFIDNIAAFEIFLSPGCRPGLSLSLGSSRCIQCSKNWHRHLLGIAVAAFIAGIALVIFMLALNMTVAVGTLNEIIFYASIIAANAEIYFLPFTAAPNFITTFISWLNLDIGFDVCFSAHIYHYSFLFKALLQLAFPAYVILLVIIVIVASECSSKFAKIIGKGNPVAVLATMILFSYAKFINVLLTSVSLFYGNPGYGSRNVDVTRVQNILTAIEETNSTEFIGFTYFLLVGGILTLLLCTIFTGLIFSWQWLLRYQDKAIFKWVRYQKLHHFLEPYHAPYSAKYRYWTGLLLSVRVLLNLISLLNFSLDPRVNLMAIIFVLGCLLLLKGVTAKRVYKNWPLDVMATAIYFNLVAFSALTWYNLDFRGNQVAAAYTSVMVIFILLLGIIVFHVLHFTRLYKLSFIEKAIKWTSTKFLEKKPKKQPPSDSPEELDGYQLERSVAGDQDLPTITYSVVEIDQTDQNREENYTGL